MKTSRIEAFSDGVIAIIITIMVLELKAPHEGTFDALLPLLPVFLSYVLSFAYVGIYWNNHHHLLHACEQVSGAILWANLHLLFWLSLVPFATAWVGENHNASAPTATYGAILVMAAVAYFILQHYIMVAQGAASPLRRAVGKDRKGKASLVLYLMGVVAAFWLPALAQGLYVAVAFLWFIPDRRIEHMLHDEAAVK